MKLLKLSVLIVSLSIFCVLTVSSYAEVLKGPISGVYESTNFTWGDGVNDLYQEWSVNSFDYSGWFYGSAYYNSNADVYVYSDLSDPTTISDASIFEYCTSASETCPSPYGPQNASWAKEGDTVFFRGINGYYGAWHITSIESGYLYGTWYFQDNGTADFTSGVTNPSLTVSPPSGSYVTTQAFDLVLITETGALSVDRITSILNGANISPVLNSCFIQGTISPESKSFRCPDFNNELLNMGIEGNNTLRVIVRLSNGTLLRKTIRWELIGNTEP